MLKSVHGNRYLYDIQHKLSLYYANDRKRPEWTNATSYVNDRKSPLYRSAIVRESWQHISQKL